MLIPLNQAIRFEAPFTAGGLAKTGLTNVTCSVRENGILIVTDAAAAEDGDGVYAYTLSGANVDLNNASYIGIFKTADTTVDSRIAYSYRSAMGWVQNIDAKISDGPLATWNILRTTVFTANSVGEKFKAFLAALGGDNKVAVTSDAHTSGVTVADITNKGNRTLAASEHTAIQADVNAALIALGYTAARADLLAKLNITGLVASSGEVTSIQNNTSTRFVVPDFIERPDSGSTSVVLELFIYDEAGNMEVPDSVPTFAALAPDGSSLSANLSAVTTVSNGRYRLTYTVPSNAVAQQVRFEATVVEGAATRLVGASSWIVDTSAVDFTANDRALLAAINADYARRTGDYATPANVAAVGTQLGTVETNLTTRTLPSAQYATADSQTSILNRLGAFAGSGANSVLGFLRALMRKDLSVPSDVGGAFDPATDSMEAIRDRGDSAWITGAGGGGGGATVDQIADRLLLSPANKIATDGTGRVTVGSIGTDVVNATALAADAVAEIQNGLATSAAQTTLATAIAAIQNNTSTRLVVPIVMELPDTGTTLYEVDLLIYDEVGNMEALDSTPTITVRNPSGTDRSAKLSALAPIGVGHFRAGYTLAAGDPSEQLTFVGTVTEGGAVRTIISASEVMDADVTGMAVKINAMFTDYSRRTGDYATSTNVTAARDSILTAVQNSGGGGTAPTVDQIWAKDINGRPASQRLRIASSPGRKLKNNKTQIAVMDGQTEVLVLDRTPQTGETTEVAEV